MKTGQGSINKRKIMNSEINRPIVVSKLSIYTHTKNILGRATDKSLSDDELIESQRLKHDRSLRGLEKVTTLRSQIHKIGPGSYSISPVLTSSHSFSSLPRFLNNLEEKFNIRKEKSPIAKIYNANKHFESKKYLAGTAISSKTNNKRNAKSKEISIRLAQVTKTIIGNEVLKKRIGISSFKQPNSMRKKEFKIDKSCTKKTWIYIICVISSLSLFKKMILPEDLVFKS